MRNDGLKQGFSLLQSRNSAPSNIHYGFPGQELQEFAKNPLPDFITNFCTYGYELHEAPEPGPHD